MINYSLNYMEDLKKELQNKKIICIITNNLDLPIEKKMLFLENKIDIFVCTDCAAKYVIKLAQKDIVVYPLVFLECIFLECYCLLIHSHNVDYVKLKLNSIKITCQINCFTINIYERYYFYEKAVIEKRYIEPVLFWYEKYLSIMFSELSAKNRNTLINKRRLSIQNKELKIIHRIILTITTKCNLKCKDCLALTTKYEKQYDIDYEKIISSLNILLDTVDKITCVELLGGEPFLYLNFKRLLADLIKFDAIEMIEITTNGTITPTREILNLLQNKKIFVRLSDYKLSESVESNINLYKKNSIKVIVQKDLKWMSIGNLEQHKKSNQQLLDEYALCFEGLNCKNILNGKLYNCTFASRISDLNISDRVEYLDLLYNENITWEKILKFFLDMPSNACYFCNLMNPNNNCIPSGIQINCNKQ